LAVVVVTFASGGYSWVHERNYVNVVNYLLPVAALALFAGIGGVNDVGSVAGSINEYEGLTTNSNMMGWLLAAALPVLLWNAYRYRRMPQVRWLWLALLAAAAILLLWTHSRSSILIASMVGIGFCFSFKMNKTRFTLALIAAALLVAGIVGTAVLDVTYDRYVLKGQSREKGVLYTRADVWQKSYDNAKEGGWLGVGYGATVGDTQFSGGLTAATYGREKGNAQLGIIEETGLVGFAFYLMLVVTLFGRLILAYSRTTGDIKVTLGIAVGSLAGLMGESVFEAWWDSPGSVESAYFWSLVGVALGLAQRALDSSKLPVGQPPTVRRAVLAPVPVLSE
jgi:O-antigen ligase